jgi:hypothetical protein
MTVFHKAKCEQRKTRLDWLATNTGDITSQSHSLFVCSREKTRQLENRLNTTMTKTQLKFD